ncbi:MAG: tyrosine-type recombinase/integrase [Rhodothermia bacterium]|nr:tyrosine-type recombinase/integrase [Rhodothermia bacterium]
MATALREYMAIYKPVYWAFEGQKYGPYSARSVQMILRKAVDKSGVNHYTTVHTLRHSFATHLLAQGMELRYIQALLCHERTKTTEGYTHITEWAIAKFVSPLDHLTDL